jgi:ADP-ribose pyrophosphatase YjhB (NUDIX family)
MRLAWNWLIVKDKKILLLKRNFHTKAFPWYWTVPWGRQEKWETAEQTAIREVKEESNLDFVPTQLFHTNFTVNSWENIHSHRYLWEFSWEIKIQEKEATDYGWFTYEETLTLEIAFDYADVFKKLREEKYL